jgi:hypothetical protein
MKAKITEVKKLVRPQKGSGPGPDGPKPPKNIDIWDEDDEEDDDEPGDEPGDDEPGDDEPGDDESKDGKPGKPGKSSGSGRGDEWEEVEPAEPGASYEVTPWQQPSGPSVVGEVLPTGSLGDGDASDRDAEAKKEQWKAATTAAESQSRGNIPGGIRAALQRMRASIVDWRKELEVFIDDAISKSKYTLPSRRFLGGGKAQYGYKKYKEDFECVVVAIDTSGSITDSMVAQFLSEAKSIVDAYSPQDLYVIFCHTSIYRVDHIQPGDPIEVGNLKTGGTEFYPPFKWTEENLLDKGIVPSVFIYFTDGEARFPSPSEYGIGEYEDKCIWVLLTWNGQPFPNAVPFGNRIDITLPNKEITSI